MDVIFFMTILILRRMHRFIFNIGIAAGLIFMKVLSSEDTYFRSRFLHNHIIENLKWLFLQLLESLICIKNVKMRFVILSFLRHVGHAYIIEFDYW